MAPPSDTFQIVYHNSNGEKVFTANVNYGHTITTEPGQTISASYDDHGYLVRVDVRPAGKRKRKRSAATTALSDDESDHDPAPKLAANKSAKAKLPVSPAAPSAPLGASGSGTKNAKKAPGNFPCPAPGCNKTLSSKQSMKKHYDYTHGPNAGKRVQCRFPGCTKDFSTSGPARERHEWEAHGMKQGVMIGMKQYTWGCCRQEVPRKPCPTELRRHLNSHPACKPFQADLKKPNYFEQWVVDANTRGNHAGTNSESEDSDSDSDGM